MTLARRRQIAQALPSAASSAGSPGLRGNKAVGQAFHANGVMIRIAGGGAELTPPLVISESQIGEVMDKVGPRAAA